MSSAERSHYGGSFLSDDFHTAIRRRLRELGGFVLFAAVGIVVVALATWSVNDPSLSYATSAPVRNLLGATGAIAADLAMQLFGVATIAIILPPAFWGWRLFTHRILDRLRWRMVAWIGGLTLSAAFASCLTRPPHWPLPTGIGGVTGDALLRVIATIAGGPLHSAGQTFAATIFGTLAFLAVAIASGFGLHQTEDEDEHAGSISIGWLVHAFLSLETRAIRSFVQLYRIARPGVIAIFGRPVSREWPRAEPRLGKRNGDADEPSQHKEDDHEAQTETLQAPKTSRKTGRSDRKSADGYTLPAINLLAAPKASERAAPSMEAIRENATALEHVLSD
ncbi:MAG TPA: DNA translocase FtsK 4TM domain-containing protein, partial [Xanthobacteraceae bacterium]|nr:DNA translocase FtsK 4TM domain-containing protein [Xanthobacteraceae bacterium]